MNSRPVAVLISDCHFTVPTLEVATAAFKQAQARAVDLNVSLIVAGDTLDAKAIIRAEVANRLLEIIPAKGHRQSYQTKILVGNHDKINERSSEHSLNFLKPHCDVIQSPVYDDRTSSWLIPYYSDPQELTTILAYLEKPARLIMHQGVKDTNAGHYIQDKSALPQEAFSDFRVISGHYHAAQDIKTGSSKKDTIGLFSYIGNPYTLNFAEANDPPKGFAVLYDDGSLERIPTNLRKHVVVEEHYSDDDGGIWTGDKWVGDLDPADLVWLKRYGPQSVISKVKKENTLLAQFRKNTDFKLDLFPTDAPALEAKTEKMTGAEILDALIDNEPESDDEKQELKDLWRDALENPLS